MADPASRFVHLHLHTNFSMLDGALKVGKAIERAASLGMPSIAITDHGGMFGAVSFYEAATRAGLKPIVGMEAYVARGPMSEKSDRPHHLVLLAKDLAGYRNLMYLSSMAYKEGFFRKPRIDRDLLAGHSGGLVALSACMAGEIPRAYREHGVEGAVDVAAGLRDTFGKDDFWLEIQETGQEDQARFNAAAREIARRAGVGIVATNDVHYLDDDDARAHQVLVCIGTGKTLADADRMYSKKLSIHFRTEAEMRAALPDFPDAVENTIAIAERCDLKIALGKLMLPDFPVPDGEDMNGYLARLAREGLERRLAAMKGRGDRLDRREYEARLSTELAVIAQMGFTGYFLIVWDFIRFAKGSGIPVGPGRGSGGGSLVAWAVEITDINPIRYGLVFERFLNPERQSMPDFDIDFCKDRRDEVIRYVTGKYGEANVSQIATFHELKSKLVIRDVGRVLGMAYAEVDRIAKLIPAPVQGKTTSIDEALKQEPRLKRIHDDDPRVRDLMDLSRRLEGLTRHAGTHAAGIVISDRPIHEHAPLYVRAGLGGKNEVSTQYDKNDVEHIGLVKFDFLGLKTLTALKIALDLIAASRHGEAPAGARRGRKQAAPPRTLDEIPLDDAESYEMIAAGDTTGVFQLESQGFRDLLRRLRPRRIEDIIAAVALYRPGPLQSGTADSYIDRKNGLEPVNYQHPAMEQFLEETYGVMIYQEQVMQAARVLAGFSMAEADNFRRAMGKKDSAIINKQKSKFLAGCAGKSVNPGTAAQVFDQMAEFASYAFNKSHSAGYAIIAYQTAYLKAHYPEEFLAALMTCDEDKIEKLVPILAEGRSRGIPILPPEINTSGMHFTVVPHEAAAGATERGGKRARASARARASGLAIRFGLLGVKGVGQSAVDAILRARADGPFVDLFDFCARVDLRSCNRANIEQLIKAGAFDEVSRPLGVHRAQAHAALDAALEAGKMRMKDREEGQTDLLGMLGRGSRDPAGRAGDAPGRAASGGDYPQKQEESRREMLKGEKAALGCYVSGHPLEKFQADTARLATATISSLADARDEATVSLVAVVESIRDKSTRGGKSRVGFLVVEDLTGRVECVVPPAVFADLEARLRECVGEPCLIKASVEHPDESGPGPGREGEGDDAGSIRLVLQSAESIDEVRRTRTKEVHVYASVDDMGGPGLDSLGDALRANHGRCPVILHLRIPGESETEMMLPETLAVTPSDALLEQIERAVTGSSVELR